MVTVVIVNYNRSADLMEALRSVKQQSLSGVEILVVDNASTDDSRAMLSAEHPDVRVMALGTGRRNFERYRRSLRFVSKRGWFGTSPRVLDRHQGFKLWEEYLEYAGKFSDGLGDRYKEVRYEDILGRPREILPGVVAFCDLNPGQAALDAAMEALRSDRSYAFRRRPELVDFWQKVRHSPWMTHYGYDALPDTE